MPTFDRGDVVRVPFPYTDREVRQHRPALVVSAGHLGDHGAPLWVLMITSAEITTIEARHAERIGRLGKRPMAEVDSAIRRHVGLRSTDAERNG